jgi:hypothetical protein
MRFGPTEPDRVDIVTTLVRAGRASAAVRADVVQHGAVRAVAEAWLVEPAVLLAVADDADAWPPPEACPPAEPCAPTDLFEERLVTTRRLPGRSERWARSRIPTQSPAAWIRQLEHVLLLGDHLFHRGREPGAARAGTPLDLAISWYCAPERGWLRLRTDDSDLGDGFVTRSATVWSGSGHVVARARGIVAQLGRPASDAASGH